jgi:hypothetical protein
VAPFWFLAGVLFTLASIILLLPWLRTIPGLGSLPTLPWPAGIAALLTMAAVLGLSWWSGLSNPTVAPQTVDTTPMVGKTPTAAEPTVVGKTPSAEPTADSWKDIASALGNPAGDMTGGPVNKPGAGPMVGAIASLQRRLAKGGGTADDWELLAKSYEFLGRTAEAGKARAHQLPPLPADGETAAPQQTSSPDSGVVLSGEVSLADALKAKAAPGTTLFIVAKSVDSPGAPVAVFRTKVGSWPLKFDLSDSESMLPGRNLSSAGRVTVEARISRQGQPLPAPGDLQGSTSVIRVADHQPLHIVIDKVIP